MKKIFNTPKTESHEIAVHNHLMQGSTRSVSVQSGSYTEGSMTDLSRESNDTGGDLWED